MFRINLRISWDDYCLALGWKDEDCFYAMNYSEEILGSKNQECFELS